MHLRKSGHEGSDCAARSLIGCKISIGLLAEMNLKHIDDNCAST